MSSAKTPQQQRQLIILGCLGVVLAVVLGYQLWPSAETPVARPAPAGATPPRAGAAPARPVARTAKEAAAADAAAAAASGEVEQVHLDRLSAKVPEPTDSRRNPFSLAPEAPPPSATVAGGAGTSAPAAPVTPVAPPEPTGPPPPPPVAPIALKFIGTVTVPSRTGRVAAFSDGKFVYYGREGEVIEGRYRIVKIGEESVQVEYADGRGRQTIRLSGK